MIHSSNSSSLIKLAAIDLYICLAGSMFRSYTLFSPASSATASNTFSHRGDPFSPCWQRLSAGMASIHLRMVAFSPYNWPSTHIGRWYT